MTTSVRALAGLTSSCPQCALAKLSYLLSKDDLTPAQIRRLVSQPLRGELTLPVTVTAYSSPLPAGERLRTLFARVIECAPSTSRAPQRPRSQSNATSSDRMQPLSDGDANANLPDEFNPPWPVTLKDEEAAEQAILPLLLGQAAARSDSLLDTLLASIVSSSPGKAISANDVAAAPAPAPITAMLNDSTSTASLQTPLHLAALAGQPANVELLLAHGASVHARDVLSHSPLFYGARAGDSSQGRAVDRRRIVQALKAAGAHLSEAEIENGAVGLEMLKAKRAGDVVAEDIWVEAAGDAAVLERAMDVVRQMLSN